MKLAPVLVSSGILLAGNGLQGTLISIRADMEGFSPAIIGLIGAAYYLGFMLGCRYSPPLIAAVGHIRVYAAFAAIGAVGALVMALVVGEIAWMAIRFVIGVVFAGLSMVTESWLNEQAGTKDRGRVLGLYRTVDLGAVTAGQFLLPIVGPQGPEIFVVVAIFFCLALVPVALSRSPSPEPPKAHDIKLTMIWGVSPLAAIGVLSIGLTNSAFRIIGPLYAGEMGFDVLQMALFMSAGILGGAIMPLPLGWLSDRYDRRWVMIGATGGAAASGMFLSLLGPQSPQLIYVGSFLFGAFALPLYSLSIAHANDFAKPGDFIDVAACCRRPVVFVCSWCRYRSVCCLPGDAMVWAWRRLCLYDSGPRLLFAICALSHDGALKCAAGQTQIVCCFFAHVPGHFRSGQTGQWYFLRRVIFRQSKILFTHFLLYLFSQY